MKLPPHSKSGHLDLMTLTVGRKPAGQVSIALQHKDEILRRMSSGEPITAIAKDLGYTSHAGIIERLGDDPDYQAALRSGIVGKIEKREQELEEADTNVTVTRADRLLGHARWWAERLDPKRFGAKQEIRGSADAPLLIETDRESYVRELARQVAFVMRASEAEDAEVLAIAAPAQSEESP